MPKQPSVSTPGGLSCTYQGENCVPEDYDARMQSAQGLIATPDSETALRPHLVWELRQILARVTPADFTTVELMSVLTILAPVHARTLNGVSEGTRLRVVR